MDNLLGLPERERPRPRHRAARPPGFIPENRAPETRWRLPVGRGQ